MFKVDPVPSTWERNTFFIPQKQLSTTSKYVMHRYLFSKFFMPNISDKAYLYWKTRWLQSKWLNIHVVNNVIFHSNEGLSARCLGIKKWTVIFSFIGFSYLSNTYQIYMTHRHNNYIHSHWELNVIKKCIAKVQSLYVSFCHHNSLTFRIHSIPTLINFNKSLENELV